MSEADGRSVLEIAYAVEPDLSATEFRDVLVASTLAERRPVGDAERLAKMLRNSDIVVTARCYGRLVGVSRAITDFSYCCYVADLAVDAAFQRRGIGRELIALTRESAGEEATLIVIAAPAAKEYYARAGLQRVPDCWALPRTR